MERPTPGRSARDLLRSLTAVRGAALTLTRDQRSLSAGQRQQLLSVVGEQSAEALDIMRSAIAESCGEGDGVDNALERMVDAERSPPGT